MKKLVYVITIYIIGISSACFAASPDGTTIPPATQIVDSNGAVWTADATGARLCYRNGVQASGCSNVQLLLYYNNVIYVGNTYGTWYQWNGSTWTVIAGDPRSGGPSPSGTTIPPATQIVDSNGGVWTVDTGGVCYRNGVQASGCSYVKVLLYYNNVMYVENTYGAWYQWNGSSWTVIAGDPQPPGSVPVVTYHYDTLRTGWNNQETTLTATNFPSTFGILQDVTLDGQVDAQPLVVPGLKIAGVAHDVVYVVTESNTIYGIDASSGAILLQRNLGSPVPAPFGCSINGPNVGIDSTPVIDLSANALYVIAAYVNGSSPSHQIHALNLTDLTDKPGSPVTVAASHKLTNGSTIAFNSAYQRQRPALLELNGNIYAGFGSYCDYHPEVSRGWVLGWNATTLASISANQLNDTQATSPTSYFLSSVWMSGYGIAGVGSQLFFATGNSDCNYYVTPEQCPSQSTYDGKTNIQESVMWLQGNLAFGGTFTPSSVWYMDVNDLDLSSGGVMCGGGQRREIVFAQSPRLEWGRLQLGRSPRHTLPRPLLVRTVIFYGLRWQ
jgi:hypothetical protein